MFPQHLLDTRTLTREDAVELLDIAEEMAQVSQRDQKKIPALRSRTVVNLFFEDSTRTRTSFEIAAKRLSADVVNFAAKGSSVSKGEGLKDTAQTLQAMGADAVVIRHPASGAAARLAQSGWITANVVNAGDGTHEHPTQALLDAFTLRRHFHEGETLEGRHVLIVGDILHSRVARSNLWLLRTLGAKVSFAAPPTLIPHGVSSWPATVFHDFDEALEQRPDALMMLRVQRERMQGGFFPSAEEYRNRWGLSAERYRSYVAHSGPDAAIMHPGPMNRGLEICDEAADSSRSLVLEQVQNGVAIRMAVLYRLLAGKVA